MPRRIAQTGPELASGITENVRIDFEGNVRLTGKNRLDNATFEEFTPLGELRGWTLDKPPQETGFGVYLKGPGHDTSTRQAILRFGAPHYDQNTPLIDGSAPPDQTHKAQVPPFSLPPEYELVDAVNVGFAAGWWAVTYAYAMGSNAGATGSSAGTAVGGPTGDPSGTATGTGGVTQVAPLMAIELGQGQGIRIPLGGTAPEGVAYIPIGMAGPFPTELEALDAREVYEQKSVPTTPRLPAFVDLPGPYEKTKPLSFTINTTKVGAGSTPGPTPSPSPAPDPTSPVPQTPRGGIPNAAPAIQTKKVKKAGKSNANNKKRR